MKPRVVILTNYFLPGTRAGGPVRSLSNLISALGSEVDFYVLTRNHDVNATACYDAPTRQWIKRNNYHVMFLSEAEISFHTIVKVLRDLSPSMIYLNSLFSVKFSFWTVLARTLYLIRFPILLAPRGELDLGAMRIKMAKKYFFVNFVRFFGCYRHIYWHATNAQEAKAIKVFTTSDKTFVIPNIPLCASDNQMHLKHCIKKPEEVRLVYLSRIDAKKNLDYALEILSEVSTGKIVYDIIGDITDKRYWAKCEAIIETFPNNISVRYLGHIAPESVLSRLNNYHAMFLPTKAENYGHVIIESLIAGCLVLISDQTPWRHLETEKVGWDLPLKNRKAFHVAINELLKMDNREYLERQKAIKVYLQKYLQADTVVAQYRTMFQELIS